MKKLIYIPLGWETKAHPDLYHSFCKEFETLEHETLLDSIEFKPDYIYVQCGALRTNDLFELKKETGAIVIQWTGNCTIEPLHEVLIYKNIADLTLLASGIGQKEMYENILHHPVHYWQHAVAPSHFRSVKTDITDNSIRFVGSNYGQFEGALERTNLCELLTKEFESFEVWGNGFADPTKFRNPNSIPYREVFDLYNKSYICVSSNILNSIEGYWSNRPLDIMASGSCCLMRYVPNMESVFTDMKDCVFYKSNEEAVKKIKMLINNPSIRNSISLEGQKKVMEFHDFDYRVKQLKKIINE